MTRHSLKRFTHAFLILIIVSSITFLIAHWLPGDPAALWVGDHPTKEQLEVTKKELGLDRPIHEQYFSFLKKTLTLDLGVSLRTRQPVTAEIFHRSVATFELVFISMSFAILLGLFLGLKAALHSNTKHDYLIRGFAYLGLSVPVFWLGMILQLIFFGVLQWLPLQGRYSGFDLLNIDLPYNSGLFLLDAFLSGEWALMLDGIRHIFLPVLTMAFGVLGIIIRTSRSALIETMGEPFFKTYLAYGLSPNEIAMRSAYKNTLIPVSTVAGLSFGLMLGGTFLVESIFDWPGLGQFSVLSLLTNDFPAIIGVTLFYTFVYIVINLTLDIIYPLIDPRIQR